MSPAELDQYIAEFRVQFLAKHDDYGNDTHKDLGAKAQFVDINRKVGKLRRALWQGVELKGEQPREVCLDLIGHIFLTLDLLDHEAEQKEIAEDCC